MDLKEIRERGKLIAVTNFNTTDYFIYGGKPMGFEYELLQRFAEYSGLQLEIIVSNDVGDLTAKLLNGNCDLIAVALPVTSNNSKFLSFAEPLMQSRQVLVQRKPDNWKDISASDISNQLVRSPIELNKKTIVVQRGTAYAQRLRNIANETGNEIEIVEVPEDEEQIIQFVAGGEVDYTVCDERIAQVNQHYYPQIDANTIVSFPQNLSWAVRKNSNKLLKELNTWLIQYKRSQQYALLYAKYYQNHWTAQMVNSDYFVLNSGRLSPYDDYIKKYSDQLHWDWRLLASLIYQESNFNPSVQSNVGAYGLMQITPATALRFGVDNVHQAAPITNIAVGVMLLNWLDKKLKIYVSDPNERVKFVLAAYNIGLGHIFDAQLLAKKYGKNMTKWDDVKEFLLNKSYPKFYNDPLVKFGYCGGTQTVNYVADVLGRFKHYKNIASDK
jgi:membrane-bound lytic murein transglycosylase F